MSADVVYQMSSFSLIQHLSEENSWLFEIRVGVAWLVPSSQSTHSEGGLLTMRGHLEVVIGVGLVIWFVALIAVYIHWAISNTIGDLCSVRTVNGNLIIVWTQSMTMSVRVRKQSALQHFVH